MIDTRVLDALDELRREVAALKERITELETPRVDVNPTKQMRNAALKGWQTRRKAAKRSGKDRP